MTGKIRKKEGKALAAKNKKLSAWLRDETRTKNEERVEIKSRRLEDEQIEDMEWLPDPAVERERAERKAAARKQQEQFLTRMMVSKLIQEIVEITPAASAVGKVLLEVMEEATRTGMINEIWNDIGGDDDMIARIGSKIKDRESTRRTEELEMKRTARLLKKENISKKWMEERKMESLLEGMRCLEVGAFEGEWSEHEMLDEWMMAALEEGGLIDDDDAMTGVKNDGYEDIEDMEVMETMDDNSMMEDDEIYEENENEECYEDWLAKELLAMDVDGGTCDLIKRKTTFLNISSIAYYGGGTWYMDR